MKIDEIAASWDRVKVSLGAAFRLQRDAKPPTPKMHGNQRNLSKCREIHENR